MAAIRFEGVSKVYPDGTRAVDALELAIGEGEFMVFVGPSGCGKTTALRMVAGLEDDQRRGRSTSASGSVNDVSPKDRDIAMVFQNYALYPHMTVAENLGFGLKLRQLRQGARSTAGSATRRPRSTSRITSSASRGRSPAASASASRSGGRSCASRPPS